MSLFHSPKIVTNNLVLYLDAVNPKSYPGSGNTWYDLSGKGNNCNWGTLPTFNTNYFTFNGSSMYGTITNNSSLDFSSEQTLIMILRHTYTSGRKNPWNQAYGGYGTWTHENGNMMTYFFGDAGANSTPYIGPLSPTTSRSVWNILCTVRNTTNYYWYLNTIPGNTSTHAYGVLTTTSADITIGSGYAGYWQGDMSLVQAYNRALSVSELQQNFNALKGRYGL